jgi:hypothetical protein
MQGARYHRVHCITYVTVAPAAHLILQEQHVADGDAVISGVQNDRQAEQDALGLSACVCLQQTNIFLDRGLTQRT